MTDKLEKCVGCEHMFATRVLRFVKAPDGTWKYLCTACRKKWRGDGTESTG